MQSETAVLDFLKPISHDNEYISTIHDILFHPEVQKLSQFVQHKHTTRLEHSISVSYLGYKICKKLNLDAVSAARGGLLHDFFLYDWRTVQLPKGSKSHAIEHPRQAIKYAKKHFELNKIEENIIARHMWPITITPPKYIEAMFIMLIDKYCATLELFNINIIRIRQTEDEFLAALARMPYINGKFPGVQEGVA